MKYTSRGGYVTPIPPAEWTLRRRFPLRKPIVTIGRASDADIPVIGVRTVSRTHVVITTNNGDYYVAQCSKNPTLVKGLPLLDVCKLEPGDVIQLAENVSMRFDLLGDNAVDTEPNLTFSRQIVVILFADVVGFTRLMEADAEQTAQHLAHCHRIFSVGISRHGGELLQKIGDCILALFSSLVLAVSCARALQHSLAEFNQHLPTARQMQFRMGIHSGDIIITPEGEIRGDALNVAARVQSLANPGGVAVSGVVHDAVKELALLKFESRGTYTLKNLSKPVEIYELVLHP
jgi:class 3 adenylate cyclase